MKANRKLKFKDDESGVSEIIGVMLMIMIGTGMAVLATSYFQSFEKYVNAKISYIDQKTENTKNNNNGTDPYIEHEYNNKTHKWEFWYCEGHDAEWVKLTPEVTNQTVNYTLNIIVVGKGNVTKQPSQFFYAPGTQVKLTAVPDVGHAFSGWYGDSIGVTNPITITMNNDKTIVASFGLKPGTP
jgi:uncharacterized repeat protein (TIGR02543 family)